MSPIIITTGEPAGIGPDICVLLAYQLINKKNKKYKVITGELSIKNIVLCGDIKLLRQRALAHKLDIVFQEYDLENPPKGSKKDILSVLHIPCKSEVIAGKLDVANSLYVLQMLNAATLLTAKKYFSALVTAPINKSIIAKIEPTFSGHTEFLADLLQAKQSVMMLVNKYMRVALITTHLPLNKVSESISSQLIESVIKVIDKDLSRYFLSGTKPKIAVCGLNPHAGESGHLGNEEIDCINPTLKNIRNNLAINAIGALPADTLFAPKIRDKYDVIVAMYHDQGLAVIKSHGFGECVNVTLGLPIIRTSVDHGTAIDLAGKNKNNIDFSSLSHAINLAKNMVKSDEKQLKINENTK